MRKAEGNVKEKISRVEKHFWEIEYFVDFLVVLFITKSRYP